MLAVPTDRLPDDAEQWAYEMKWDGYRAIVEVAHGRLLVTSRRGLDVTKDYPELAGIVDASPVADLVIDGELVVLDDDGHPSFAAIQRHLVPAVLMCFDVLRLDGADVTELPWHERRRLLEALGLAGPHWQTPPIADGRAADAVAAATALGLEGVVAKRRDAPYRPGVRSSAWRKLKLVQRQELVVGGWLPGEGRLSGTVGSLLLGVHDEPGGPLRYAGRVGSGLDDRGRDALAARLARRETSPFVDAPRLPGAVWVEPDVVAEVKFTEWTDDGVLRQPVFLGLRADKDPADVVRET
jgi:bifunctional non-homologous end joining protein LigD